MKKFYFFWMALFVAYLVQPALAQEVKVKQVIVASGGNFSDPDDYVTLGTYNPEDSTTTQFGTIYTQSVQSAVVYDHFLYVAAQDSIVAYDIDSYQRVAAVAAAGVNRLAVTDEKVIASFWYPDTADFVRIYKRDDLSQLAVISEVSDEAAGIVVFENRAYVAVPGGYAATTGKVAVIDLNTDSFLLEMDLGEEGARISDLYLYQLIYKGDVTPYLISVNRSTWDGTTGYIMKYNLTELSLTTTMLEVSLGEGVGIDYQNGGTLYVVMNGGIGAVSLLDLSIADTTVVPAPSMTMAAAAYDVVNERFYVTTTDYYSTGEGLIYDKEGELIGNFDAGIAAEALAIDYRSTSSVPDLSADGFFTVYPNPASEIVNIAVKDVLGCDKLVISDLTGREVLVKKGAFGEKISLDVSQMKSGLYLVTLYGGPSVYTAKLVIR